MAPATMLCSYSSYSEMNLAVSKMICFQCNCGNVLVHFRSLKKFSLLYLPHTYFKTHQRHLVTRCMAFICYWRNEDLEKGSNFFFFLSERPNQQKTQQQNHRPLIPCLLFPKLNQAERQIWNIYLNIFLSPGIFSCYWQVWENCSSNFIS